MAQNNQKQIPKDELNKVKVIPARIPCAMFVADNTNVIDVVKTIENNEEVSKLYNMFVNGINKLLDESGYKNKVGLVTIPTILPEDNKKVVDIIFDYINHLMGETKDKNNILKSKGGK